MKDKTDEELAGLVQQKRTDAFEILVDRYEGRLLRYGKRFLFDHENIKDAVQDVFVKVYINIQGFDVSKKFSSWIYRIAHNDFVNIIRKNKKESYTIFDMDMIFTFTNEDDLLGNIEKEEESKEIDAYLKEIRPKYREILTLFYFEEKDYQEISDILSIPISTVGVRLKRGREEVKKIYEKRKR